MKIKVYSAFNKGQCHKMSSSTRKKDDIFLLGCRDLERFVRLNQLPTLRQVLLCYHHTLNESKNLKDSAHILIQEVIEVWSKSGIPTRQPIEIHKIWVLLKKNKTRDSEAQKNREHLFTEELGKFFNIAHANTMNLIKIVEHREFLIDQRVERERTNKKKKQGQNSMQIQKKHLTQLLGVPKLTAGTRENTSDAVFDTMEKWNVTNQVQAMSFDTTASNTGAKKGACTRLEAQTGRDLLWLARHHNVFEIMLSKIFTLRFGPSSSPEIPLFKRFRDVRDTFPKEHYDFLDCSTREKQVRDNYNQLIELTMIVVNKSPVRIHWCAPQPIHNARWMVKLLYAMKIFLFRSNSRAFKLTKREEKQIVQFVRFGALIYTKIWIKAPLAADAPINDLQLWTRLKSYKAINSEIGAAARGVLERHLWYLSEELVAFALFSDKLSYGVKMAIVQRMDVDGGCRLVRGDSAKLYTEVTLETFA